MPEQTFERARACALALIDKYGIDGPADIDLEAIALDHGVLVRKANITGSQARLLRKGSRGIISVSRNESNLGRLRFSIAHELGHWFLHPGEDQWWISSAEDIFGYAGGNQELEANAFASELLLPTPMLAPLCSKGTFGFPLVDRLSSMFSASLTATALRIIDESPERCCVVLSDGENVQWSRRSKKLPDFGFFIPRGFSLSDESKAWSSTFEEEPGMSIVPTAAWFPSLPLDRQFEVWEDSRYMEGLEIVLTLMSVNEY